MFYFHYGGCVKIGRPHAYHIRLSDLEEDLKDKGFLRIQKSFIVNMRHVLQIKSYKAV